MDTIPNHLAKVSTGLREIEYEARLHDLALTGLLNMLEAEIPDEDSLAALVRHSCDLTAKIVKLRKDVDNVDPKELVAMKGGSDHVRRTKRFQGGPQNEGDIHGPNRLHLPARNTQGVAGRQHDD